MSFVKKDIYDKALNPYQFIGKDWLLLTGGSMDNYNTMTASWGQTGVLWNKPVLTVYVRPNRKTYEFMESCGYFTVSNFGGEQREALSFCGSHSGRDCDKAKETGLVPVDLEGNVTFEQAETVFLCKKLYIQDMKEECFLDKSCLNFYKSENEPFHRMFVGEIIGLYTKE